MTVSPSTEGVDFNETGANIVGVVIFHGFLGPVSSFGVGGVGLTGG